MEKADLVYWESWSLIPLNPVMCSTEEVLSGDKGPRFPSQISGSTLPLPQMQFLLHVNGHLVLKS